MLEKLKNETDKVSRKTVSKIELDITSDKFSPEERIEIVKMVKDDVEYAEKIQEPYIKQKKLDLQHYHGDAPSKLENLKKSDWQSDRNLGLARAVGDSYQATIFATAWNPDSINFVATKVNELDNRSNQEKFTKWGMGKQESDAKPEVDSFIHNRIIVGSSFFKIYKKVWYEWVDKRIPVKNKNGDTYKYDIKTERVRFEKGVIENIADIDDILMPAYGKDIQELPYFVQILHLDGDTVLGHLENKVFKPLSNEEYKKKLYAHAYKEKERVLGEEKLKSLGISIETMSDIDVRRLDIDLYEWYGYYTKGGRREKFRFIVDLVNDEFLSGKPIRKINRSGKIPYTGGALNREPGQLRGVSLMQVIAPIVNAFNNVFNQKSDFQYVTNCPFGFHNPQEGYQKQVYELKPMVSFPVEGKPSDSVYFPNLSRSMAWAESDIKILFEVLEKLTGAATYFQSSERNVSASATRDVLVDKNSETRFGLWVSRIQEDISEAISMWFELYQDYPPKNLAERVLGKDGKQLFQNLTIDTLRGDTVVQMTPDVVAGSKAYRKELQLWALQAAQGMVWLNPQVNPAGNWELCSDTFKTILNFNDSDVRRYLGEKPKVGYMEEEVEDEWVRFLNGEDFEPPEGVTAMAIKHLEGHTKQKEEKYQDLSEEARPNFDAHLFKTMVNVMQLMKQAQQEAIASRLAATQVINNPQSSVQQSMQQQETMQNPLQVQPQVNPQVQLPVQGQPQTIAGGVNV